jgi:hypothetical protein
MWELEISKVIRIVDMRLAKYCHEVSERLTYPATVKRFYSSYAASSVSTGLYISAGECPGHSLTLEHPKLYTILRNLDEISKMGDLYGTPFSNNNPGIAAIGRLYYNCTGYELDWLQYMSERTIAKPFQTAIDHLLDYITGRGAMPTLKRYTRNCRMFSGDSSIEPEDLLNAARGCNLSVAGMTYWKILENFPLDCIKIDEELKKMGKL